MTLTRQAPIALGLPVGTAPPLSDGAVKWWGFSEDRRRALGVGPREVGRYAGSPDYATEMGYGLRLALGLEANPGRAARVIEHGLGLRVAFQISNGRQVTLPIGLRAGFESSTLQFKANHDLGLRMGWQISADGSRSVDAAIGLRMGIGYDIARVAPHSVGLGLGVAHLVGRLARHEAGLRVGATHDTTSGKLAAHNVGLVISAAHTSQAQSRHNVGLVLGATHLAQRSAGHAAGLQVGAAHVVGRTAAHVVGLRLGVLHRNQSGDVGQFYAIARSRGSRITIRDAAVLLSAAGGDLNTALAIVPDL